MSDAKKRETVLGLVMLVVGLAYMFMASQLELPQRQFVYVNAAFAPYVLATGMCILGVLQLGQALKAGKTAQKTEDKSDYFTVLKTLALIIGYAALLQPVGFPIMTVVYLFLQFIVLTPGHQKPSYPMYAIIAVLTSACVYALFRHAFDMLLPVGLLGNFIN